YSPLGLLPPPGLMRDEAEMPPFPAIRANSAVACGGRRKTRHLKTTRLEVAQPRFLSQKGSYCNASGHLLSLLGRTSPAFRRSRSTPREHLASSDSHRPHLVCHGDPVLLRIGEFG